MGAEKGTVSDLPRLGSLDVSVDVTSEVFECAKTAEVGATDVGNGKLTSLSGDAHR